MKTTLVAIGNSRGVRIPKPFIEQCAFESDAVMTVEHGAVVIRPARKSRRDWGEAFQKMAEQKDDTLIDETRSASKWDASEWEWK
jgi:antitoxin MazE